MQKGSLSPFNRLKVYSLGNSLYLSTSFEVVCILLFLFLFFLTSLLEYNFFTMFCQFLLYNKVNQLYIYIYPHIPLTSILPIPSLQMVTKHRADLPVLCGCFPLAIDFTFGSVYMSMTISHFVPTYPSPSPYPQVHSLVGLCLYSPTAPVFFITIFSFFLRFHIYVLAYGICFSLSDFTLYDSLQIHPPRYK